MWARLWVQMICAPKTGTCSTHSFHYTLHFNKVESGYTCFTLSICPFISLGAELCLICIFHNTCYIHFNFTHLIDLPTSLDEGFWYPRFNEVERGVYWYHLVRLSVCGHNRVRSVSSTILIGSISYLHILSSNLRRCVACNARFKIWNFGDFFKFVTLTLSSFDLGSNMIQWYG